MAVDPDSEIDGLLKQYQYYPDQLALLLWDWDSGELAGIERPDTWQLTELRELGEDMRASGYNGVDSVPRILRMVGSGRGIGKSADVGMTVTILLAAFPDAKITVMANSGDQLATKTWPEIRKWMRRSIVAHWFEANSSIIYRLGARDSWFAVPITWNLENPQASAGQQNIGSVNVIIYDEMSEIPDKIIEIGVSGLTTGLPICLGRGNATLATGIFADGLEGRYAFGQWKAKSIDARTCRFPNKADIAEAIERYGEDSDYVRVWIRGLPPKSSLDQYFPTGLIQDCQKRRPVGLRSDALIAGCDLAWGGSDPNRVCFTHGLDAWSLPGIEVAGERTRDPQLMIGVLADMFDRTYKPAGALQGVKVAHLFIDSAGSANVIAHGLSKLGYKNVTLVNFGGHSVNMAADKNIRSQIIRGVKEYMEAGAGIGGSKNLEADLMNIQKVKTIPLQFEDKDLIRKRLKRSTDELDALALTRYAPVQNKVARDEREGRRPRQPSRVVSAWS